MISIPPPSVSPSSVDANRPRRRHSGGTRDAGGRSEIPPKDLEIPPSLRATPKTKVYPFFYLPFSFAETGPNRLTVGKIYGGMLILENWKMTRFAALPPARKGLPVSPPNNVLVPANLPCIHLGDAKSNNVRELPGFESSFLRILPRPSGAEATSFGTC